MTERLEKLMELAALAQVLRSGEGENGYRLQSSFHNWYIMNRPGQTESTERRFYGAEQKIKDRFGELFTELFVESSG